MRPTIALALTLAACSSDGARFTDGDFDANDTATGPEAPEPPDGNDGDTGIGPGEDEEDRLQLAPAQTDVFVFVANPERDTVTRVNVRTQEVRTTRVGRDPRVVRITADYATAVVFNRGDDTVSVIDADTLDQDRVSVRDNLNVMALAPGGRWAVLWHSVAAERPDDPRPGPATSYNEVSLVDVRGLAHIPLVVGFTPKDVAFAPDGSLALVVADASLAVIRLAGDTPVPEYVAIADPLDPPVAEEVVVDPTGARAFVRQRGTDRITVVDLATLDVDQVDVAPGPTDLDLTPDGTGAVVVSRTGRVVSVLSVADPFATPREVPFPADVPLGQVILGPGDDAILFTTATATNRYATWSLAAAEMQLRPLAKPLASLSRTPTGGSLLAVHTRGDNPDGTTPEPYRGKDAVSLIDLGDFRANTIALTSPPTGFANSADGRRGYLVMEGEPVLAVLDYASLIFDALPLRSDPVFVGVLPDLDTTDGDEPPAWVSQAHPLGRLSFYDPDDRTLETITGFELNGAIEE